MNGWSALVFVVVVNGLTQAFANSAEDLYVSKMVDTNSAAFFLRQSYDDHIGMIRTLLKCKGCGYFNAREHYRRIQKAISIHRSALEYYAKELPREGWASNLAKRADRILAGTDFEMRYGSLTIREMMADEKLLTSVRKANLCRIGLNSEVGLAVLEQTDENASSRYSPLLMDLLALDGSLESCYGSKEASLRILAANNVFALEDRLAKLVKKSSDIGILAECVLGRWGDEFPQRIRQTIFAAEHEKALGVGGYELFDRFCPKPSDFIAKVVNITTGDRLSAITEEGKVCNIRLANIYAPRIGQHYWEESRDLLSRYAKNTKLIVKWRSRNRDGDIIGILFRDTTEINLKIVRAGYAWFRGDPSAAIGYRQAEDLARSEFAGLWQDPNPIKPWEYGNGNQHN